MSLPHLSGHRATSASPRSERRSTTSSVPALPPLSGGSDRRRAASRTSSERPTRQPATAEQKPRSRGTSQGVPPKGRRNASGCALKPEKIVPRPPVPLRLLWLDDGARAAVESQVWDHQSSRPPQFLVAEPVGIPAQEMVHQYALQYNVRHCVADGDPDECQDSSVLELKMQLTDWIDMEPKIVEWKGVSYVAALMPDGPCAVQLRLIQRQLPETTAAWTEWARNARKESDSWLSRASPPVLVGLPPPAAPAHSLNVSDDGLSLVVRFAWYVPSEGNSVLGDTLLWQYRWRRLPEESEGDGDRGHMGEWCQSPTFECAVTEGGYESPWLSDGWHGQRIIACLRYSGRYSTWSRWSASSSPLEVQLGAPGKSKVTPAITVKVNESDPTTADLRWQPFIPASRQVRALQYLVDIRSEARTSDTEDGSGATTAETVCVIEHLDAEEVLCCRLQQLDAGFRYHVRVRARHWRIDSGWRSEMSLDFKGWVHRGEIAVSPKLIPSSIVDISDVDATASTEVAPCFFWLPPPLAAWELPLFWFESQDTDDDVEGSAWKVLPSQCVALRETTNALFKDGRAMEVQVPRSHERVTARCRHASGMWSPTLFVVPFFASPEPPVGVLCVEGEGITVIVHGEALEVGSRHATRCQFSVTIADSPGEVPDVSAHVAVWHELPAMGLSPSSKCRWRQWFRAEDPGTVFKPITAHCFRARLGDDGGWSAWSDASEPLTIQVAPPRPAPGTELIVQSADGLDAVELAWPRFQTFSGLNRVDYHIDAAPVVCPHDVVEQLLLGALVEGESMCRARLRRLVPDTEYIFSVTASYPKLSRFCAPQDAVEASLVTVFTTATADGFAFQPPEPPKQVLPETVGGPEHRSPWRWDFWLNVDRRAILKGDPKASYIFEWRALDAGTTSDWKQTTLRPESDRDGRSQAVTCHWDFACEKDAWQTVPPERIELRLRMESEALRIVSAPSTWFSLPSVPLCSAFAAPPKPQTTFNVDGDFWTTVSFALSSVAPGGVTSMTDPEAERACLPSVPDFYGHRFATRYQLRYCPVGDSAIFRELASSVLDRQNMAQVSDSEEPLPEGWSAFAVSVPARHPDFILGEKYVFSVRIGDSWRWSAWSGSSRPLLVEFPALQPATPNFVAIPRPPNEIAFKWQVLHCKLKVPVQCTFWLAFVLPDGRTRERQPVATYTDVAEDAIERELIVDIGCIQPGMLCRSLLLARLDCNILGPHEAKEIAASDIFTWPSVEVVSCTTLESWAIPPPQPLPVPEHVEAGSGRWRGRTVLLAWPKGTLVSDNPPLELQGCAVDDDQATGWVQAQWSLIRLKELAYIVAGPLSFVRGRLRWFDRDRRVAGPRSEVCVSIFEAPVSPVVDVFCSMAEVRAGLSVALRHESHTWAVWYQVRHQMVAPSYEDGEKVVPVADWTVLEPMALPSAPEVAWTHGGHDGLKIGKAYVFSVRVSDGRRRSQWSPASTPVVYDVPVALAPQPTRTEPLLVEALSSSSVRFWWHEILAPEASSPRSRRPVGRRPMLEYRLDVSRCLDSGAMERQSTVFFDDFEDGRAPIEATAHGLLATSKYFAAIAVRFARLGTRTWQTTGLNVHFETPAEPRPG